MVDVGGIFGKNGNAGRSDIAPPIPPPAPGHEPASPMSAVISMQQQGVPNQQIVNNLTQQGFNPEQINDAMNMADAKGAVEVAPQQPPPPPQASGQQQGMPPPPQFMPESTSADERIEELAEAIIDEKWKELSKNIDKIIDWKEKTETKVTEIGQEFEDIKKNFESLHDAILGKVSEYDQNIINLSSEIKAMELVFQKLLPTFTANVSELSKITKDMKKK